MILPVNSLKSITVVLMQAFILLFISKISLADEVEGKIFKGLCPGIILVVLDACRADKFSCMGFPRETTPAIDQLASDPDTVIFGRHYVQAPSTSPSTAALFTGLVPVGHVVQSTTDADTERVRHRASVILDDQETLAQLLQKSGYYTVAFLKSPHLDKRYGYSRGFNEYNHVKVPERRLIEQLLRISNKKKQKFFAYLHLLGCHNPFPKKRRNLHYMQKYGFNYDESARKSAGIDFGNPMMKFFIVEENRALSQHDSDFLNLVYESQLRRVDDVYVSYLIKGLKKAGIYDDMMIIITADHGEALYEHKDYAHGRLYWETVLHVPLIVKFPRDMKPVRLGPTVTEITRSIDILPALISFVGSSISTSLPGLDIFNGDFPEFSFAATENRYAYHETMYKLINDEGKISLYNILDDPQELHNLKEHMPDKVDDLLKRVERLMLSNMDISYKDQIKETILDEETEQELRSLGYIW